MRRVPWLSLASVVCPSAPFLAPRLLRIAVPTATIAIQSSSAAQCIRRSTHATASTAKKPLRRQISKGVISSRSKSQALLRLEAACQTNDVQQLQELYTQLMESGRLPAEYIRSILKSISSRVRHEDAFMAIYPFVQQIDADLRQGAIASDPYSFVFLLGIYSRLQKYHDGYQFWLWLLDHDKHLTQEVYGAAIELMAHGRILPLTQLEELYLSALKRFPGTFAEYHLSPNAIVPDRTQYTIIPDIPVVLLQGIYTARIVSHAWRPAYLALDTVLRLYPTQTPKQFFLLNVLVRPLPEAYSMFMLACRSGIAMSKASLTSLLTRLMSQMKRDPSMTERMMLLRSMANALVAYLQVKRGLNPVHVGVLLRAFSELLPRAPFGQDYEEAVAQLRDCIVRSAYDTLSGLLKAGMPLSEELSVGMAMVAAQLKEPGLFKTVVTDIENAQTNLSRIRTRAMITAAGLVGDRGIIDHYWKRILSICELNDTSVGWADLVTLYRACNEARCLEYYLIEHGKWSTKPAISDHGPTQKQGLAAMESFQYMTLSDLQTGLEQLKDYTDDIQAVCMSGSPLNQRKSPFRMHLDDAFQPLGLDAHLREVYDEYTTDPHQPPATENPNKPPVLCPTGIALAELRFQNWVTILEMMDMAQESEFWCQAEREKGRKAGDDVEEISHRLLHSRRSTAKTIEELRAKIKQLRQGTML